MIRADVRLLAERWQTSHCYKRHQPGRLQHHYMSTHLIADRTFGSHRFHSRLSQGVMDPSSFIRLGLRES